jgi:hypothetical protein
VDAMSHNIVTLPPLVAASTISRSGLVATCASSPRPHTRLDTGLLGAGGVRACTYGVQGQLVQVHEGRDCPRAHTHAKAEVVAS